MKLVKETRELVFLEFELDEDDHPRFVEFLRESNITPVLKGLEIVLGKPGRFSGTFTVKDADKILNGFCEPVQRVLNL